MSRAAAVLAVGASVLVTIVPQALAAPGNASYVCSARLVAFVDALAEIDGSLDVGLSFNEYKTLLRKANVAYARLSAKQIRGGCLSYVGVPAERALNNYTKAYNVWAACIRRLGNCTTGYVDVQMQRYWRNASANVQRALNNLGD